MYLRFGLLLNTVVKISRKEKVIFLYCKLRHKERQNDFWTKNDNNRFLSKIWEYWTDMHLQIVKLRSGGQQLPGSYKKNLFANSFNLEKSSFCLSKVCFCPNHCMLNSYTFASSSRIKIRSFDSTTNKRKDICVSCTARTKNAAFWPKMGNSQQVCIWISKTRIDKFRSNQKTKVILLHTLCSWKIGISTKNNENSHF